VSSVPVSETPHEQAWVGTHHGPPFDSAKSAARCAYRRRDRARRAQDEAQMANHDRVQVCATRVPAPLLELAQGLHQHLLGHDLLDHGCERASLVAEAERLRFQPADDQRRPA